MPAQILTTDDLREFKIELLDEIRSIFNEQQNATTKKWLKSAEVRRMLNISSGTLQTLRINGTLPYTKIGGTVFYSMVDIENVLTGSIKQSKKCRLSLG